MSGRAPHRLQDLGVVIDLDLLEGYCYGFLCVCEVEVLGGISRFGMVQRRREQEEGGGRSWGGGRGRVLGSSFSARAGWGLRGGEGGFGADWKERRVWPGGRVGAGLVLSPPLGMLRG